MNRMTASISSNRGNSMLYVIAALIVTGFIGSSMIKMAYSDTMNPKTYFSSASARAAARSGMISAIHYFESEDLETKEEILTLLRNWISSPTNSPTWIIGNADRYVDITNNTVVCRDGSKNPRFNVELIAFDKQMHNITLVSHGIGNSNSRATMTSVYHLDGLELDRDPGNIPENALQAENGNYEFNGRLTVNGNSAFSQGLKMNVGPFEFNGTFRLDPHRTTGALTKAVGNASGIFIKEFYSAGEVETFGTYTFKRSAGFEKLYKFSKHPVFLGDTLYLNGGATHDGSETTSLNNNYLYANNSSNYSLVDSSVTLSDLFTDYSGGCSTAIDDLSSRLGFRSRPKQITFNYQLALSHPHVVAVDNKTTIDEVWLNKEYDKQFKNGELFDNTFLVVWFKQEYETDGNNKLIWKSDSGVKFHGKAIIVIESSNFQTISMETTPEANVGLYIKNYVDSSNTIMDLDFFRGFIYVEEAENEYVVFFDDEGEETTYKGAIYASTKANTKFDGSGGHKIIWDPSVIEELAIAGIFSSPSSVTTLVYRDKRLSARLLSQSM